MFRTLTFLAVLTLAAAGCSHGRTPVRVLDDLSGEAVAGATVIPLVNDLFGSPCRMAPVTTGPDGRAVVPYRDSVRVLHGLAVQHPRLSQVHPDGKPSRQGGERLLYVRRPPRVVVVVPDGFTGPLPISSEYDRDDDGRKALYVVRAPPDPLSPAVVPDRVWELVRPGEIEVERGADRLAAATAAAGAQGVVRVWEPECSGMFYGEDDYIQLLFVGTAEQFAAFDASLREVLGVQVGANQIDRATLARLRRVGSAGTAAQE